MNQRENPWKWVCVNICQDPQKHLTSRKKNKTLVSSSLFFHGLAVFTGSISEQWYTLIEAQVGIQEMVTQWGQLWLATGYRRRPRHHLLRAGTHTPTAQRRWLGGRAFWLLSQQRHWSNQILEFNSQVTFTWTPIKAVLVMQWRYSATSQQEEQPAYSLCSPTCVCKGACYRS